jgi:hypothetical protein
MVPSFVGSCAFLPFLLEAFSGHALPCSVDMWSSLPDSHVRLGHAPDAQLVRVSICAQRNAVFADPIKPDPYRRRATISCLVLSRTAVWDA